MIDYLEFEGKTIDKALQSASRELELPLEKIRYDVVSHGSSGIFGLVGVKKAKIRVKKSEENQRRSTQVRSNAKERAKDLVKDAFQLEDREPSIEETRTDTQEVPLEDLPEHFDHAMEIGKDVLQKLADFISEETTVETEIQRERIVYMVSGGNSGLLIGKRGQTLEAMQYLVEKIVNKQCEQRVRVLVDVEGYLETRKSNLKKLAGRMADKAKKINKPVTIGQMNAYDRRIVHLHLKDNSNVRTQSVGEGYYRKLVIFPKKRRKRKQN
jgi:spoIIIJ-associated protein